MEVGLLRPQWALKAILIIIIGSIMFRCVSAANLTVGGPSGWDLTSNLQAWTAHTTFHVGDSLVFSYTPVHDVVEVKQEDYEACDISNPIKTHKDGETVVPLNQEGRRYFVCGRQGHCRMGLKLEVPVLPPRSKDGGGGGGGATQSPQPYTCGGPEDGVTFFGWLIMQLVITTLVIYSD